jgi:CsoR family transcriptional regulator, copper-sensing transcriptional repressor
MHLSQCVTRAVAEGGSDADDKLAEASAVIARLGLFPTGRAC